MKNKELAPIALFVYNRPKHTRKTLEALQQNELAEKSTLYVFADGPKHQASEDEKKKIEETRQVVKEKKWCKEVVMIERVENAGLAKSIIEGVTETVSRHGKIIVLEDDIVTERGFLKFMNESLDLFKNEEKVMQVSGYAYPINFVPKDKDNVYFLKTLACWGWATWNRAWKSLITDSSYLYNYFDNRPEIKKEFNLNDEADFYRQLELNHRKILNTWAVKWYASWYIAGGLCLFPKKSLVNNIGHDGTGVHCGVNNLFFSETVERLEIEKRKEPRKVKENKAARKALIKFYKYKFQVLVNGQTLAVRIKKHVSYYLLGPLREYFKVALFKLFPELKNVIKYSSNYADIIKDSTISQKAKIYPPFNLRSVTVGDYSYLSKNSTIVLTEIGKFCSIGPNFLCGWGIHPINGISTSPMFYSVEKQNGFTLVDRNRIEENKKIIIGHDVFIGMNVSVLDGVTIGNGAVIGAGSVVSKDVPPYAVAVGNPIKIIKYRFTEEEIEELERVQWWNWNLNQLEKVKEYFNDVGSFIAMNKADTWPQVK